MSHIEDIHRRIFAAMLANLDDSVGEIMQTLREKDLERDTLVFFLSDNGGPTRELTSSNLPLRGGKGDMYEGGIRIPFMAQWKGQIPAGVVYNPPVISLDMYATAAAVAGTSDTEELAIDGVNLIPYLTDRKAGRPHETLYWRTGSKAALRHGDWKLVRNSRSDAEKWELYDLARDIGEATDLGTKQPAKLEELKGRWEDLNAQMVEPAWR